MSRVEAGQRTQTERANDDRIFLDQVRDGFNSFLEHGADCVAGLVSGAAADVPAPYQNDHTRALCKVVGAGAGMALDTAAIVKGSALSGSGLAVSATGVGALVGAPATALGVSTVAAGTAGLALHSHNMQSALEELGSAQNRGGRRRTDAPQQREQVRNHESLERARNAALEEVGPLGHDRVPTDGRLHDAAGRVNGFQSGDGLRGFRIDFDPNKGIHYNWYDWTGGARGAGGRWGAETFPGTHDQYLRILESLNR